MSGHVDLLRTQAGPWVIAHRGASASAPENTMPAFHAAWECGVSWIESDVQPTRDNVPVLLHDDQLDRTTNGAGPIRNRSADEVRSLDAGSWFTDGGSTTIGTRAYGGTPVPLLAELLATLDPARSLLLEIKGDHTREQVLAEIELTRASGWDQRVLFQSFDLASLEHVRSIEPARPVGLLVEELHDDPIAVCTALGAVAYNPCHTQLRDRPDLVDALHDAGIAVFVWTVDDPTDWEFLTTLGVDGIITNTPAQLLAWQHSRTAVGRQAQPD